MILNQSPENIAKWENQPIRPISWNGSKYEVEVNTEYQDGTYAFDFFELGGCTPLRYDPKADQILIGKNKPRIVSFITKKFPPQFERKLKQEIRCQMFQWKDYLDAQRKMYRKKLKRVQESISVAPSREEVRRLEAERARLESELYEVS